MPPEAVTSAGPACGRPCRYHFDDVVTTITPAIIVANQKMPKVRAIGKFLWCTKNRQNELSVNCSKSRQLAGCHNGSWVLSGLAFYAGGKSVRVLGKAVADSSREPEKHWLFGVSPPLQLMKNDACHL